MPPAVIIECEMFPAERTLVRRSGRAVCSHVEHQVRFLREALRTAIAFESLLARVHPHVVLQQRHTLYRDKLYICIPKVPSRTVRMEAR